MHDIQLMRKRRDAAKSALKFFEEKRSVGSTNNPFSTTAYSKSNSSSLRSYRIRAREDDAIMQSFEDAARTGVGNCKEKARICYASLKGNPRLNGSVVTYVLAVNYDHAFVLVTDAAVDPQVNLYTLGLTAIVVDGWTEDWHFPNLPLWTAIRNGLSNTPNPRQLYVRNQIKSHLMEPYTVPELPVRDIATLGVRY